MSEIELDTQGLEVIYNGFILEDSKTIINPNGVTASLVISEGFSDNFEVWLSFEDTTLNPPNGEFKVQGLYVNSTKEMYTATKELIESGLKYYKFLMNFRYSYNFEDTIVQQVKSNVEKQHVIENQKSIINEQQNTIKAMDLRLEQLNNGLAQDLENELVELRNKIKDTGNKV